MLGCVGLPGLGLRELVLGWRAVRVVGPRGERGQAGPALGRAGRGWAERGEEKGNWAGRVWGFGLDSGFSGFSPFVLLYFFKHHTSI